MHLFYKKKKTNVKRNIKKGKSEFNILAFSKSQPCTFSLKKRKLLKAFPFRTLKNAYSSKTFEHSRQIRIFSHSSTD